MDFLVNNKNFNIVKTGDTLNCFSYEKMIATFLIHQNDLYIFESKITTITNKKHLVQFKEYIESNF